MSKEKLQSYLNKGLSIDNPFILICDCETTGFSDKMHDMISFSAKICDLSLDIKNEITLYARPNKDRWTYGAEKAHGISLSRALTFPDPRKSLIELMYFIKPFKTDDNKPLLFISHDKSGFDFRFLKAFFMNQLLVESFWKVFQDDYKLSTISMGHKIGVKDNKLSSWAKKLNLKLDHHEVKSDTDACYEVLKYIMENTNVQSELEIKK